MPDIFTTFFSDSVWTWVQTIVNSAGRSGEVGTGIGRVEFSTCTDIDNNIRTESVELSNVPAVSSSYYVHLYISKCDANLLGIGATCPNIIIFPRSGKLNAFVGNV